MVNTWPTSRWLGEQLAMVNGINAQTRFPFPGARLRQLAKSILDVESNQDDPWRANCLVWRILDVLPSFLETESAKPLRTWIDLHPGLDGHLNRERWQLARSIADVFDDYALYRPAQLQQWLKRKTPSQRTSPLPLAMQWQPELFHLLAEKIPQEPFGLQVEIAIERLKRGEINRGSLPQTLRIFGISSLAPIQVDLIQAISAVIEVEIYLLTPCPDLWQRCEQRRELLGDAWQMPPGGDWLMKAPRLEATLGRMGAEFQQLLEGSGDCQLGEWQQGDLFAAPISIAKGAGREATLLEQIQQQLVNPLNGDNTSIPLTRPDKDTSVLFLSCPGAWREAQLVRDQILQWLANDPELEPRDILVMTPQVDRFAPLLISIFNDISATGVKLPWRLTDRSQQDIPGLCQAVLLLLEIAGERLTASALERLLSNPAIQNLQGLEPEELSQINQCLQRTGFRWGLDANERGGDETHSLHWCLDRWLLGIVLPSEPGLSLRGAAPFSDGHDPIQISQWWKVISGLSQHIKQLRLPRTCQAWGKHLIEMVEDIFGDGGEWHLERQSISGALELWMQQSSGCTLKLESTVVLEILKEALSIESGRFGHRSGVLTISAMEPMRAIPHKAIVLMGLDANIFPRHQDRPGFHLLEHDRKLGDPRSSDQDRYVLMEALMSSRQHLLITWNGRDECTGESKPPASPIQQWLGQLQQALSSKDFNAIMQEPAANPLNRRNFLAIDDYPPRSCDRRHLSARRYLEKDKKLSRLGLALPLKWECRSLSKKAELPFELLLRWLINPQRTWIEQFDLKPQEWLNTIEDLDALDLDEHIRHQLLSNHFKNFLNQLRNEQNKSINKTVSGSWIKDYEGTGHFPGGAAAILASDQLEKRWQSLQDTLLTIGELHCIPSAINQLNQPFLWADQTLVIVQPGRLNSRGLMTGWLMHLQECTLRNNLEATVVVSRKAAPKKDEYEKSLCWKVMDAKEAKMQLASLHSIASQGLEQCWPVPPNSGWARVRKEQESPGRGDGNRVFKTMWHGGFNQQGESMEAVMRLCFGNDFDADQFLDNDGFEAASSALYPPILEALQT